MDDIDSLGTLLRLAGPRAPMPEDRARRVKAVVQGAWQAHVQARRRRVLVLWMGSLAAAASVAFAFLGSFRAEDPVAPPAEVARVERVAGGIRRIGSDPKDAAVRLLTGEPVAAGTALETEPQGRASLRLAGGGSLRMDLGTRLRLPSRDEVVLERGALYLDSGGDGPASGAVQVRTPDGVVREIGTQFEVQVASGTVRVRVREGRVALDRQAASLEAAAGEQLMVENDRVSRAKVPRHGAHWDWVQSIAPGFELEGATVEAFLGWVSRETGRPIRFDDEGLARESGSTKVHGSALGMTPEEALSAVLPTCGLVHRLSENAIVVGRSHGGPGPRS